MKLGLSLEISTSGTAAYAGTAGQLAGDAAASGTIAGQRGKMEALAGDSAATGTVAATKEAVFTPATLALTGWWRASFGGSPWAGTASAGASGSNSLSEATNPPAVGSAQNGFTPASFDAVDDVLAATGTLATYAGATAIAGWILFSANASANQYIFGDSAGYFELNDSSSTMVLTPGGVWRSYTVGAYQLITFRFDGTNAQIGVNEAPGAAGGASTAASSTPMSLAGILRLPLNGYLVNGLVLEIGLANTISNANFANIKAYINTRYALSL